MITNYLKTGMRNILKYKTFSFINIFGLATAISVCLLIILMLADHKSYDRFHTKKDRIYRILSDQPGSKTPNAVTAYPLAATLKADYPFIEATTSLSRGVGGEGLYNDRIAEMSGYFADESFWKVFSFELSSGTPNTALKEPNSAIITSDCAQRLFNNEDPMGKSITFFDNGLPNVDDTLGTSQAGWGLFTVTGIIDNKNYKSHLQFDILMSSSSLPGLVQSGKVNDFTGNWKAYQSYTYALLTLGKSEEDLEMALSGIVAEHYKGESAPEGYFLMGQKLTKITPGIITGNEPSPSLPLMVYYFLLSLVLVILVSACLNYVNLSIARALTRTREIGVRKTSGANRKNLVYQFLSESLMTAMLALALAAAMVILIIPLFKQLWINQHINFDLRGNFLVYGISIAFTLLIGIVAGIFPALHLSKFRPMASLKNSEDFNTGKLRIRRVLTTLQFVISLLFITTSILIYNQFREYLNFDYGFKSDKIINIPLQGNNYNLVKQELNSVPGVANISASDIIPATNVNNGTWVKLAGDSSENRLFDIIHSDNKFIENLDLKLLAGENFPHSGSTSNLFVIINESAANALGFNNPSEVVGRELSSGSNEILRVVGVVRDFRSRMLMNKDKITPLILRNSPETFSYLNVQLSPGNIKSTIAGLEEEWKTIDPAHPFKYEYYEDQLSGMYRGMLDVVSAVGFLAFIAVVIACLGMLGMAIHTTERRVKEVGVRKVLGAKGMEIAVLLSSSFLKILLLAVLIGGPLSFYLNDFWLQHLPNRVDFGFGTVLISSMILFALGLLTIASQTIKVSRRNPVDSLKYE